MIEHYILDCQGNPVPEPDFLKWAAWFEEADRQVAETFFGDIRVSTVFLSLSHVSKEVGNDATMLYETMVFADENILQRIMELSETDDRSIIAMFTGSIDIQKRYATKAEAEQGHKQMCIFIATCLEKGLLRESVEAEGENSCDLKK